MVVGQVPLRRAAEGGASTGGRALPGTLRPPRQPRPAARRRRQDAIGRRLRSGATPPPQPRPLVPLSLSLPIAHRKDRPICRQRLFQLMVSNCLFVCFFLKKLRFATFAVVFQCADLKTGGNKHSSFRGLFPGLA